MPVRVVLEGGPKSKKFVAYAIDWPGWSRGAKTADEAFKTFAAYQDRYRLIAVRARCDVGDDGSSGKPQAIRRRLQVAAPPTLE